MTSEVYFRKSQLLLALNFVELLVHSPQFFLGEGNIHHTPQAGQSQQGEAAHHFHHTLGQFKASCLVATAHLLLQLPLVPARAARHLSSGSPKARQTSLQSKPISLFFAYYPP